VNVTVPLLYGVAAEGPFDLFQKARGAVKGRIAAALREASTFVAVGTKRDCARLQRIEVSVVSALHLSETAASWKPEGASSDSCDPGGADASAEASSASAGMCARGAQAPPVACRTKGPNECCCRCALCDSDSAAGWRVVTATAATAPVRHRVHQGAIASIKALLLLCKQTNPTAKPFHTRGTHLRPDDCAGGAACSCEQWLQAAP